MARGDSNGHAQDRSTNSKGRFVKWQIIEPAGDDPHVLSTLAPTTIKFTVQLSEPVTNAHHGIALFNSERQLTWGWGVDDLTLQAGLHELCYQFPMSSHPPGTILMGREVSTSTGN